MLELVNFDINISLRKMKEILTSLDEEFLKAIKSLDQKTLDKMLGNAQWLNCQFGFGSGFKTNKARWWARKWLTDFGGGEKTSFALYSPRLLEGFEIQVSGENYLESGPAIFVTNHPPGPIGGYWVCFALNWVVESRLQKGPSPYWLTTDYSTHPIFRNRSLSLLRKKVSHIWAEPGEVFILPFDLEERKKIIDQASDHLSQGGRVAVTIEGPAGKQLSRARPGVGRILAQLTQKQGLPIYPVGLWREGDNLNLRFGPTFDIKSLSDPQKIAFRAALNIARLLPEERRGFYKGLAR